MYDLCRKKTRREIQFVSREVRFHSLNALTVHRSCRTDRTEGSGPPVQDGGPPVQDGGRPVQYGGPTACQRQ